jgi:tRNA modification GTPase
VTDTILALSSGAPPAAIAVIRLSGPAALRAGEALAGRLPPARQAAVRRLRDGDGALLDEALLLVFLAPASATGEDVLEIQCHGGRAVVAAIEAALARQPGVRRAAPGEFTRRALANGRLGLNEVEGLSDLLAAETESQRRAALAMHEGHFSRQIAQWYEALLQAGALAEALLDFSDEDDVPGADAEDVLRRRIAQVREGIVARLAAPRAERLRDGIRVVIAGPPNSGKSTLLNALAGREAAIVTSVAGTTRDRIDVPVALAGVPLVLSDTAGLRPEGVDEAEAIGIARARAAMADADILLWLGRVAEAPARSVRVASRCDLVPPEPGADIVLSAHRGDGMAGLRAILLERARALLPREGDYALSRRQAEALEAVLDALRDADDADPLIMAEGLRQARRALDRLTGQDGTEAMLDRLFAGFCIGK